MKHCMESRIAVVRQRTRGFSSGQPYALKSVALQLSHSHPETTGWRRAKSIPNPPLLQMALFHGLADKCASHLTVLHSKCEQILQRRMSSRACYHGLRIRSRVVPRAVSASGTHYFHNVCQNIRCFPKKQDALIGLNNAVDYELFGHEVGTAGAKEWIVSKPQKMFSGIYFKNGRSKGITSKWTPQFPKSI